MIFGKLKPTMQLVGTWTKTTYLLQIYLFYAIYLENYTVQPKQIYIYI